MSALPIPRGMFRDRKLLDLAHRCDRCMNCERFMVDGCEPAHSNEYQHGKAKALKSHDCFHAALCHECHAWYDNQRGGGNDPTGLYDSTAGDKVAMFARASSRTFLHYWRMGWLKVAA